MQEEIFISGRHLPKIDPFLEIWHWQISTYLFLGGLSAGILFFAALFYLLGKENDMKATIKTATIIAPLALIIGLGTLFIDLSHKLYFWRLYTTVRITSPMSWGAWVLLLITPLSILWVLSYSTEIFPSLNLKFSWLKNFQSFLIKNRKLMAIALIPLSIILGVYTGILLSAFNARPLWNNAILGPLFLTSGLSTGAASILLFSKSHFERKIMSKIDLALIFIELFLITHMLMGMYAGSQVQLEAMQILVSGDYTVMFFVFVIILGLLIPAVLELTELIGFKVPIIIPSLLVLMGGLIFRIVMINAGQLTRYLY
ncbi:MAG: nitrite reductase [Flavobacteriales bacterium CG03_land_8_20_14_0_80_35_15]|nr:polysulfide reductase NrfD [Zetaproteobacteria bacterium]NDK17425.1 polysulfide reductase NrfD [Flavobacteriales bacterium]OIO12688.1 MAG: nitrite reductase [Flavobacteriaceae bacterium CG1_02_35_72]PIR12945.1 MAG: nitrite reductase [Flavobacteriales bacterium CG11_big_fil_rev_8_21_14_0_20_35_7]PIV16145.1 MAG: nitrite reductase [Flavobacteriales bacterium CG03_land_8_20_14_0_80_35_15]PIX06811.1 MAG: nitrite reductase [Flavobacteriales bacterium CG_4_8_14_3_um_filter_35_10]PJA04673.1 MAG: n